MRVKVIFVGESWGDGEKREVRVWKRVKMSLECDDERELPPPSPSSSTLQPTNPPTPFLLLKRKRQIYLSDVMVKQCIGAYGVLKGTETRQVVTNFEVSANRRRIGGACLC